MVLSETDVGGIPIIGDTGLLIGYITQLDLIQSTQNMTTYITFIANEETSLSQWVDYSPLTGTRPITLVSIKTPAEAILELFLKLGVRILLVVEFGVLVGVIHKKQMLKFMSRAQIP